MDYHERIVVDPRVMVGKPVIRGTRVTVELILQTLSEGMTMEEMIQAYPRTQDGGHSCGFGVFRTCSCRRGTPCHIESFVLSVLFGGLLAGGTRIGGHPLEQPHVIILTVYGVAPPPPFFGQSFGSDADELFGSLNHAARTSSGWGCSLPGSLCRSPGRGAWQLREAVGPRSPINHTIIRAGAHKTDVMRIVFVFNDGAPPSKKRGGDGPRPLRGLRSVAPPLFRAPHPLAEDNSPAA